VLTICNAKHMQCNVGLYYSIKTLMLTFAIDL